MKKSISYMIAAVFALALLTGCRTKAPATTTRPPHTPTATQGTSPSIMPEPTSEAMPSPEATDGESIVPPTTTPKS